MDTNTVLLYLVPILGIVGILVMAVKSAWVSKQDVGDANMAELAKHIADGAMAFLKAEWKVLAYFVVIASILLGWSGTMVENSHPVIAITFVIGAFLSAFAGWIGMNIATKANVRTTQAARTSLAKALSIRSMICACPIRPATNLCLPLSRTTSWRGTSISKH